MAAGAARRSRHSLAWRFGRAIESATAGRPLIRRTGPAWAFGILGLVGELAFAPVVLATTIVIGLSSYLLLDAPWTKIRAQQRPRFVSVRILYLNALILTGFWLAVMFAFSAADPSLSNNVEQGLPALLDVATARDFRSVVQAKQATEARTSETSITTASTWFNVFLHGLISALTVNLILYGIVVARRRSRMLHTARTRHDRLHFDSTVGLFVDGETRSLR